MALVREILASTWTKLTPEMAIFTLLLFFILSILLLILCSNCGRHSFDLRRKEDRPESLIRVVSLEDALAARENPIINNITKDEKEFQPEKAGPVTVSASIPESSSVPDAGLIPEDSVTWYPRWRSHMRAPDDHGKMNKDMPSLEFCTPQGHTDSSPPPASPSLFVDPPQVNTHKGAIYHKEPRASVTDLHQHIYDVIGGDGKVEALPVEVILEVRSNLTKQPDIDSTTLTEDDFIMPVNSTSLMEEVKASLSDTGWNPLYAEVKRSSHCPALASVPHDEEEDEVEESSPPLPDRSVELQV